ncbi:MAG: gliding motility-associated C-terminal domain-containing protein [Flavobacteriales bacterium]|nr:gliding motility-associated C-terminal domain-containing protein [Flavobacteriales bacterium]
MNLFRNKIRTIFIVVIAFSLHVKLTHAQTFVNGDLNGITGNSNTPTNWIQIPFTDPISQSTGWQQATSDLADSIGNFSMTILGVIGIPFSGTTFSSGLHCSNNGNIWQEGIMQPVVGFIPGNSYCISFYQAVVKQLTALDQSGSWRVYVDGLLIATTAVSSSSLAFDDINLQWDNRITTFTATATTHTIKFLPWDDDSNIANSTTDTLAALRMGIDLVSFIPSPQPTIMTAGPFCPNDPAINLTATPTGGTWSGTGITNTVNGTFDPSMAGLGNWVISYIVNTGRGISTDTINIDVTTNVDAGWAPPTGLCVSSLPIDLTLFVTGDLGGTWSGTGINGSFFDPSVGTQTITYSVGVIPCNEDSTLTITITSQNSAFNYTTANYCLNDPNPTPIISGTNGGVFMINNNGSIDSNSGQIDIGTSGVGSYDITYVIAVPCPDTSIVTVTITTCTPSTTDNTILIPNVFTPNGDGFNDVFTVGGANLESVKGQIFNRWGQKLFSWNNVKGYWDGKTPSGSEAPDGTYFYIIKTKGINGVECLKKGEVNLMR